MSIKGGIMNIFAAALLGIAFALLVFWLAKKVVIVGMIVLCLGIFVYMLIKGRIEEKKLIK